jgi:hypothetical protein
MDDLTTILLEAMEQAAISGLCREGQLEIAVQELAKAALRANSKRQASDS